MLTEATLLAALFIVGSILGSFFNVVIYRVPRGESIVRPPSACPACGTRLRARDNIPVLGYLLLRGKCRYCAAPISPRYPVVEVLSGILPVLLFARFGPTVPFFVYWPLFCVLLVLSFIDLDLRIIPDKVTLPGIVIGIIVAPTVGLVGFWGSLLGVVVGGGALYLIGVLGELLLKKESMGGGDVKLAAMLGAFMGWKLVLVALFVAFFVGAVIGVIVMARKPKDWDSSLPFGPFIALGAVLALLWGQSALAWYSALLG